MKSENIDKYNYIINTLGEKKIFDLYAVLRSEKISLVTLVRIIKKKKIKRSLEGKKSIARISKEIGVSEMTIYRMLRKNKLTIVKKML